MKICRFDDNRLGVAEGVGPVKADDTIVVEVQGIGRIEVAVRASRQASQSSN